MSCPVCVGECQCGRSDEALRSATGDRVSGSVSSAAALAINPSPAPTEAPEWKHEVSSRVSRYRSRRRSRSEHNRSLVLDFETPAPPLVQSGDAEQSIRRMRIEASREFTGETLSQLTETVRAIEMKNRLEESDSSEAETEEAENNIIEFPRLPAVGNDVAANDLELADPVVAPAPRIFEAEEAEEAVREQSVHVNSVAAPPLPTFMLEVVSSVGAEAEEDEPEFELPLPVAPIALRSFALACDLAIVSAACLLFAATLSLMGTVPPDRSALGLAVLVSIAAWCFYQRTFLTRQGSTPGMRVAGLALSGFEQQPLTTRELKLRAWGVMLSSVSLGLGFAWALLDEDRLSWHDRISRTCTTLDVET